MVSNISTMLNSVGNIQAYQIWLVIFQAFLYSVGNISGMSNSIGNISGISNLADNISGNSNSVRNISGMSNSVENI